MRRFLSVILMLFSVAARAQTMCVRDSSLVLSLDGGVTGEGIGGNRDENIWWVDFSYGRVYGESTCLSVKESLGQTNSGAYYGVNEYANTPIQAIAGLNGFDDEGTERKQCWCRLTHPAVSLWVLGRSHGASGACPTNCINDCANFMKNNNNNLRSGLFKTVGL
jgi:hypothetical protein